MKRPLPEVEDGDSNSPKRQKTYDNRKKIVNHYNERDNQTIQIRDTSPIFPLRKFNNWIKTLLLQEYCFEDSNLLDICGGKGGDLTKYLHSKVRHVVLVDVAEKSVRDAVERYNKILENFNKKDKRGRVLRPFEATFICGDCHKVGVQKQLESLKIKFDIVCCQFALHYSFETEEGAKQFLKNVSCSLAPGGIFIATIPSANRIVYKLNQSGKNYFGNEHYKVTFEQKGNYPKFGAKYTFYLQDAIDSVPEYLVHDQTLFDIAKKEGLTNIRKINFQDYYRDQKSEKNIKVESRVRKSTEDLEDKFKEIAEIYNIYIFKKDGYLQNNKKSPPHDFSQKTNEDIIIVEDS